MGSFFKIYIVCNVKILSVEYFDYGYKKIIFLSLEIVYIVYYLYSIIYG